MTEVAHLQTTNADWKTFLTLAPQGSADGAMHWDIEIMARSTAGVYGRLIISCGFKRISGTVSYWGTPVSTVYLESGLSWQIGQNVTSNNALVIVSGQSGTTIDWYLRRAKGVDLDCRWSCEIGGIPWA